MEATNRSYATRDDYLSGFDRRYDEFQLPSGKWVRIQNLTEKEKSRVDAKLIDYKHGRIDRKKTLNTRTYLICACVVDTNGKRVFRDEDVERLSEIGDSRDIAVMYTKCQEWVGGDAEDFENLVGNSGTEDAGGSPSNLPTYSDTPS